MMMMMVVVAVVTVATVPIIGAIVVATIVWLIVGVRAVRIIVPIWVVAWSEPNAEVHLSIQTWRRRQDQAPCHQCD